ncbi:MAG: serine hydrolase domain-containing protein, partial [Bacteroidota bacterium]
MNLTKKLLLACLLLVSVIACASAQSLPDSTIKKIDNLFKYWDYNNSPGYAIGIVKNDSLIFAKGYGMANLEYNIPIKPETIFHMASVSKQFTAFSIVLLARQGKLNLDDDIRKYLPWFPDLKVKITVRNLLNHTSG